MRVRSDKLAHMLAVLSRPLDSFYEIRYRGKGSVPLSLVCVAAFSASFTLNRLLAGYVVNEIDPRSVDGVNELLSVFLLFLLFCVGNWSVTCLMDGDGRFRDIVTVTGYSLLPLVLIYTPATILSRFIASGEEGYYRILLAAAVAWAAFLILSGIMTVHNYTLGKTLITLFLTLISMFIIIFLGLLLFDLINQVYVFGYSIYTELAYRY